MKTFKEQCRELRKRDFTLPEIAHVTGKPKTSVYFHIKDIPLSTLKQKQIKEASGIRARKVASSRKGKSLRPYRTFTKWTADYVLLTSHFLFDGELSKSCVYNNRNLVLVERVEKLMRTLYDFAPATYKNPETEVERISYHNVALASFLKKKAIELVGDVDHFPLELQREFVRAFFDDEGCMDYRVKRNLRCIRGYQDDGRVLRAVQKCLAHFGIDADLKGRNEVVIVGRENLLRFQQEINFSKGVRINGNRSNSLWKESLEKRILLDRAIKSFRN